MSLRFCRVDMYGNAKRLRCGKKKGNENHTTNYSYLLGTRIRTGAVVHMFLLLVHILGHQTVFAEKKPMQIAHS